MKQLTRTTAYVMVCLTSLGGWSLEGAHPADAAGRPVLHCPASVDAQGDTPIQDVTIPPAQQCVVQLKNGFPVPDPACTPGAVNPSLTLDVLRNRNFKTACVRDKATTREEKASTYEWYGIEHPSGNTGANQICELDHFISLELGGADTLDNIWPQCGPPDAELAARYFKEKDTVENYLAYMVKSEQMELSDAQQGIAIDWTQYLEEATRVCPGGRCPTIKRTASSQR